MKKVKVIHTSSNQIMASDVFWAQSFFQRLKGLMFVKDLKPGEGMLIEACQSIHTFFMKFPLDVLFLDRHNIVVKVIKDVSPWRMTFFFIKAQKVLEFKSGTLPVDVYPGDKLEIICIS